MAGQTIIKRSPIVLIGNLVAIEFVAFIFYYIATNLDTYKYEVYAALFRNFFSYDTTKLLFLSLAQLVITIYAFLRWYYESYTVKPGSLTHSWGVFFRHHRTFPLEKSMTITLSLNPLSRPLHFGSIRIESPHYLSLVLKTISRPWDYVSVFQRNIDPSASRFSQKPELAKLILKEEGEGLEFKSSLRFDHKLNQLNRDLEKAVMKTVAAFLNTKGGLIIIGLDNERKPLGLKKDYETIQRKDSDGFENHFTQVFNAMIGPEFRHLAKVWFDKMDGQDICLIQIAPSHRPVYLKINENEHFFVRTGNITTNLKFSEVESYARSRWPRH